MRKSFSLELMAKVALAVIKEETTMAELSRCMRHTAPRLATGASAPWRVWRIFFAVSKPHPEHKVYPYLLKDVTIIRPNQVWSADITYIRLRCGFLCLVAIMDWFSRYVLAWRLSNSLEAYFCLEALSMGCPEIFNTDQGSLVYQPRFYRKIAGPGNTGRHGRQRQGV